MRHPPVLVLAASKAQAEHHAERLGLDPRRWVYLTTSPSVTRGRKAPVVYRVGTWYTRPDLGRITEALAPCAPVYIDA